MEDQTACSIDRALQIIGDRWTILILRDAFRGIRRFDDFRRDLDIARPVLAERLRRLVDTGLMTKERYQDHPERFEYRLTRMGRELSPALVALMRWGDEHLSDGTPTVLVHDACGTELHQGFWCPSCRTRFDERHIASRPGTSRAGTASPDSDTDADTSPDTSRDTDTDASALAGTARNP